jgi:hypothetical protein
VTRVFAKPRPQGNHGCQITSCRRRRDEKCCCCFYVKIACTCGNRQVGEAVVGQNLLRPLNHAVCSELLAKSAKVCLKCATQGKPVAACGLQRCTNITAPDGCWVGASDRQPDLDLAMRRVDGSGLRKEKGISHVQPCSLLPYAPPKRTVLRFCTQ